MAVVAMIKTIDYIDFAEDDNTRLVISLTYTAINIATREVHQDTLTVRPTISTLVGMDWQAGLKAAVEGRLLNDLGWELDWLVFPGFSRL